MSSPSSLSSARGLVSLLPFRRTSSVTGDSCCIPAEIHFGTVPSGSDGLILRLSRDELLFREASHYVLDRTGSRVTLAFLSTHVSGGVVSSQKDGYHIRLAAPLEPDLVGALLDEYGVEAS